MWSLAGEAMEGERRALAERVAGLEKHGKKFEKAIDTVLAGGVKECRFLPSGRRVYSVVGTLGDEFIDPERPYCSCGDFYFRVTRGKEGVCYHLLSFTIASETGRLSALDFSDDEYADYFGALVGDVFEVLTKSG
jgi:predicted nucleic acid-binding Zn finger protein